MKWQIAKLLKETSREILVDEEIDFSEAVRKNPDLRGLSKIKVTGKGSIFPTSRTVTFDLKIAGTMTLPCALTLDDVEYKFEATISPTYIWDVEKYDEDSDDYLVKDVIEIASAVWQEIFVQIPLRVVKEGAYEELQKQGVEIVDEEAELEAAKTKVDPRFEVLKNLKFEK